MGRLAVALVVACGLATTARADDDARWTTATGRVLVVRPPVLVEVPRDRIAQPLRLKFDDDDRNELRRAGREQAGGVILDVLGVIGFAVGSAFFVPLAREDIRGDTSPAAWAGAGVASIVAGAALLGGGIHLYLRGHRREVRVIDRVFKRGALVF